MNAINSNNLDPSDVPIETDPDKSGFRRIKAWKPICRDPSHNPPTHLVVPPGFEYEHICPACGARFVLRGSDITLSAT